MKQNHRHMLEKKLIKKKKKKSIATFKPIVSLNI